MQKFVVSTGILLAAVLIYSGEVQADPIRSGPQVGEKVPGAFAPLNVTGANAGQKCCQYCQCGARPVVAVFARDITPAVIQLVKTIDNAVAAHREEGLSSYVVFCNDGAEMGRQLQEIAQKEKLQNVVLTVYQAGGPAKYRLAADADVTVLVYHHFTVTANHALKNGDLTEAAIGAINADVGKMLADR